MKAKECEEISFSFSALLMDLCFDWMFASRKFMDQLDMDVFVSHDEVAWVVHIPLKGCVLQCVGEKFSLHSLDYSEDRHLGAQSHKVIQNIPFSIKRVGLKFDGTWASQIFYLMGCGYRLLLHQDFHKLLRLMYFLDLCLQGFVIAS